MNEKTKLLAAEITQFLDEHKAQHPIMIDVSEHAGWTDCFIIGTVNSLGHLKGLTRSLWSFLADKGVEVLNRHKSVSKEGWELIDCDDIVIHLMSEELREFYNLEKLWHIGKKIDFMQVIQKKE